MSDNDTQDSGFHPQKGMEGHPRRRKSRRHEERLKEVHAAAVKKVREEDLAYRSGAFLPEKKENIEATLTPVTME